MKKYTKLLSYYGNIVVYIRICALFSSVYLKGAAFGLAYILCFSLDYFDGLVARHFNQISKFGCCIDILTDLLQHVIIIVKMKDQISEKKLQRILISLYFLDFYSNFLNFHASLILSGSHKQVNDEVLAIYYDANNLFYIVGAAEFGLVGMYLAPDLFYFFLIPYLVKSFFHVVQLKYAFQLFTEIDIKSGVYFKNK